MPLCLKGVSVRVIEDVVMELMLSESISYDKAGKRPSAFVSFIGDIVCPFHLNSLHSELVQVLAPVEELCDLSAPSHH